MFHLNWTPTNVIKAPRDTSLTEVVLKAPRDTSLTEIGVKQRLLCNSRSRLIAKRVATNDDKTEEKATCHAPSLHRHVLILIIFTKVDSSTATTTMASRNNTTNHYHSSNVPVPHDRREEELQIRDAIAASLGIPRDHREEQDQIREAIAASLGTTVDRVNPELVRRSQGGGVSDGEEQRAPPAPRRSRSKSQFPMTCGYFC